VVPYNKKHDKIHKQCLETMITFNTLRSVNNANSNWKEKKKENFFQKSRRIGYMHGHR